MAMNIDEIKAKIIKLSFKASTRGLTPEEETELSLLKQSLALQQMKSSAGS